MEELILVLLARVRHTLGLATTAGAIGWFLSGPFGLWVSAFVGVVIGIYFDASDHTLAKRWPLLAAVLAGIVTINITLRTLTK
jgi:uncharacterized protein YqgC (DUF456 family)